MNNPEFEVEHVDAIIRVMPNGDVRDIRVTGKSRFEELNAITIAKLERLSCRPVPAILNLEGAEYPVPFRYQRSATRHRLSPPIPRNEMSEQWRRCVSNGVPVDLRITGCTSVIEGGRRESIENLAIAFLERAGAYSTKGVYDLAIPDYSQVIQLTPQNADAFHGRGFAHLRKREFERAMEDYDQAIRLDPQRASAFNSRCWARVLVGRLDEALADCNESLRLRPYNASTLDSRGLVHLKSGRMDRAVADYDEALRLRPNFTSSLYGRGLAKQRSGEVAAGTADVDAAKAIQADIVEEFISYGVRP